jgi:hypothetical protein
MRWPSVVIWVVCDTVTEQVDMLQTFILFVYNNIIPWLRYEYYGSYQYAVCCLLILLSMLSPPKPSEGLQETVAV